VVDLSDFLNENDSHIFINNPTSLAAIAFIALLIAYP
jgi:hypothetical protein